MPASRVSASSAWPAASWRCTRAGGCERRVIAAFAHLSRLTRAGFVFAREGVLALVDPRPLPMPARSALWFVRRLEKSTTGAARTRLATALTTLGPAYVKLGQFLATRPDVVGVVLARDLETLQDRMAPFPLAQAERVVAAALDKPLDEVFKSFGPPVAAASIAQVHRDSGRRARGRRQGAAAVHRAALQGRPRSVCVRGPQRREALY